MGHEGEMLMNVVAAVKGARVVLAIYICASSPPPGSSPASLERCCGGDVTCVDLCRPV